MEYSINALAQMAGVTTRTLRHYHQIALLSPLRTTAAGYRMYGPQQLQRLQQILFYRELGMELLQIKQILDNPDFDTQVTLQGHLQELYKRRARLDALILNAQNTLQHFEEDTTMLDNERFEGFKKDLIKENEEKYGAEIHEKYGEETVTASNAKMMNMTKEQYDTFTALGNDLNEKLAQAVALGNPASTLAQEVARLHKEWLCFTWPKYNAEAHRNITQMYVDDSRFTAYYEAIASGGAAFLRDAVALYLDTV